MRAMALGRSNCAPSRTLRMATWLMGCIAAGALASTAAAQQESADAPRHRAVLRISAEGLRAVLSREIHVVLDVEETILDARVTGKTEVVSRPDVQLVSDHDQAAFRVVLKGIARSKTVSSQGAAVVRGRSETTFVATRPIVFEPGQGFRGLETDVRARTEYRVDDVSTDRDVEEQTGTSRGVVGRVIQRRATQRLESRRTEATQIARQRAEDRIREVVERRIDRRLARLNAVLQTLSTLSGSCEPLLVCCSSPDCVQLGLRSGGTSPASWTAPPPRATDGPVSLWLHESLLGDPDGRAARGQPVATEPAAASPALVRLALFELARLAGLSLSSEQGWLVLQPRRDPAPEIHLARQPAEGEVR